MGLAPGLTTKFYFATMLQTPGMEMSQNITFPAKGFMEVTRFTESDFTDMGGYLLAPKYVVEVANQKLFAVCEELRKTKELLVKAEKDRDEAQRMNQLFLTQLDLWKKLLS